MFAPRNLPAARESSRFSYQLARAETDSATEEIGGGEGAGEEARTAHRFFVDGRIGNSFASVPRNARGCGVFRSVSGASRYDRSCRGCEPGTQAALWQIKALNLYPVLSAGAPATGPQTPAQETPVGVITQHLYIAPGATKPQSCTFKP